jgi:hypothetical protein
MIEFGDSATRSFLRVGSLGLVNSVLSLPAFLAAKATAPMPVRELV